MTITLVDVGTTANDGTGDPLRTAFQTVNTAITAINNAVVVGTGTTTFKDDSGTKGIAVASNGDVTFTNAGSTAGMTWDASGNSNLGALGVGIAAPLAALHVANGEIWVGQDGVLDGKITFRDSGSITNEAEIYTDSNGSLFLKAFAASSTISFTTGNPSPQVRLQIALNGTCSWFNQSATEGMTYNASSFGNAGALGINETNPDYKLDVNGTFGFTPGSSVTPVDNGDIVFEATSNTVFTVKLKGSDGVVRSGTITLA
uniref:Uncharacterized protein n=1 Tax=Pseudo-nitzschia multiseries DNA virus TaxID=2364897 RepID=A0A678W359_9VIRU|nr:hypothetical protein PmDNAV1_gp34 [Pseudo-nitzschia multiseries DNA virus]AYD75924.1 hypothetical protein PmDNAV1_gp40 [Pseudo-nitzschia multiseries DNA virus]